MVYLFVHRQYYRFVSYLLYFITVLLFNLVFCFRDNYCDPRLSSSYNHVPNHFWSYHFPRPHVKLGGSSKAGHPPKKESPAFIEQTGQLMRPHATCQTPTRLISPPELPVASHVVSGGREQLFNKNSAVSMSIYEYFELVDAHRGQEA